MIGNIAVAVIVMLLVTASPSRTFSKDEKTPDECDKYIAEMSEDHRHPRSSRSIRAAG